MSDATCKTATRLRHGHSRKGRVSPTYQSWLAMWKRCTYPKHPAYSRYGGRGITVCERWRSFDVFLADMGARPDGTTLERIGNDADYGPDNCRWATDREQANNTTSVRLVTFRGESLSVSAWSRRTGLGITTIKNRLDSGWTHEDALTRPVRRRIA